MSGRPTKLIGLTGAIAAGKSTVCAMFADLGAAVVDADALGRELLAQGTPLLRAVVEAFGEQVLGAGGELDRAALGRRVFASAGDRRRLEQLVHPAISALSRRRFVELGRAGHPVIVYEAALLFEAGRQREMEAVVLVVADDELRRARLVARDGITAEGAGARMAAQLPQEKKVGLADYVIDNSGTREATRVQVEQTWQLILEAKRA